MPKISKIAAKIAQQLWELQRKEIWNKLPQILCHHTKWIKREPQFYYNDTFRLRFCSLLLYFFFRSRAFVLVFRCILLRDHLMDLTFPLHSHALTNSGKYCILFIFTTHFLLSLSVLVHPHMRSACEFNNVHAVCAVFAFLLISS